MSIKIVFAENHELYRNGFVSLVEKHAGIKIAGEARNGTELLDLIENTRPDVVITDIVMPKLDGIEVTKIVSK